MLQDLSADDTADAGLSNDTVWVLRRLALEIGGLPRYRQSFALRTWCSGTGPRWAERRSDMTVDGVVQVRAAAIWAATSAETLAPVAPGADFTAAYREAAGTRRVSARLTLPTLPSHTTAAPVAVRPWVLRAADIDLLAHVNNASYWSSIEESLVDDVRPIRHAVIEFRDGVMLDEAVDVHEVRTADTLMQWWMADGRVRATMAVVFAATPGS